MSDRIEAAEAFVDWLTVRVLQDGRGDLFDRMDVKPSNRFWLGRLAPADAAWKQGQGERAQRLDPSAIGMRIRPAGPPPWTLHADLSFRVWSFDTTDKEWVKGDPIEASVVADGVADRVGSQVFGDRTITEALVNSGNPEHAVQIQVDTEFERGLPTLTVTMVNRATKEASTRFDPNVYQAELVLSGIDTVPFALDSLPDSFRYDRAVAAYGINAGVRKLDGSRLATSDVVSEPKRRPKYWAGESPAPDLRFDTLSVDPFPSLQAVIQQLESWGEREWSAATLLARAEADAWSDDMLRAAKLEGQSFLAETMAVREGLALLSDESVLTAFQLVNKAMRHAGGDRYDSWRPFQLAFLLLAIPGIVDPGHESRRIVDTLWFATGGGKTETYLGIVLFAALLDRIRGKRDGITAWSRFPLRMLSLQQTQRFADALAGAEVARVEGGIEGAPFSLGFFVGAGGTPNKIRDDPAEGEVGSGDPDLGEKYRVLLRCPFCRADSLTVSFDRRTWRLAHRCSSSDCWWTGDALPFYIVDEEIYRFLPTVVVGTLDKAASVGSQAAMRGIYAGPLGLCSGPGHGYTYAPRRANPTGCLVPGCGYSVTSEELQASAYAPSVHIQDELHLLSDTLGAIDSHYETIIDYLQETSGARSAKKIASSATLSGFEEQSYALYMRQGRAFPLPGPRPGASFWTADTGELARNYVGLAPRGVTLEFANDRVAETLQKAIRKLDDDPESTCAEIGISSEHASFLVNVYGTNVVYGSKLRDIEAAARSFETQPPVDPLDVQKLTGNTPLDVVRETLRRLDAPEDAFDERVHIVCASSMMSHGVDVDRFNVITMLGLPLSTAEFIQTTARIGRRWPGLVFVLHRMGVERDASVFRSFELYVRHGDRFIEPIAITRRSRRVLEHTFAGAYLSRVLGIHEPASVRAGMGPLTTVTTLKRFYQRTGITEAEEFEGLRRALGIERADDAMARDLETLLRRTMRSLLDPVTDARFPNQITPRPPMRSLREVETPVVIREAYDRRSRR